MLDFFKALITAVEKMIKAIKELFAALQGLLSTDPADPTEAA